MLHNLQLKRELLNVSVKISCLLISHKEMRNLFLIQAWLFLGVMQQAMGRTVVVLCQQFDTYFWRVQKVLIVVGVFNNSTTTTCFVRVT